MPKQENLRTPEEGSEETPEQANFSEAMRKFVQSTEGKSLADLGKELYDAHKGKGKRTSTEILSDALKALRRKK